jgi:hypothetical protein
MPDVRTPGVPATMRRLGDLRLECRVLVDIAKNYLGFLFRASINTLMLTSDWCSHESSAVDAHRFPDHARNADRRRAPDRAQGRQGWPQF